MNRKIALTILLYSILELNVRRSSNELMLEFETNQADFYEAIRTLTKLSLAKAYSGSVKGGFEKIREIPLKELCEILRIEYQSDQEIITKCKKTIKDNKHLYKCEICENLVKFLNRDSICSDCLLLEPEVPPLRKAKCGHMSRYRYYKCEKCVETLEADDEEIVYQVVGIERV